MGRCDSTIFMGNTCIIAGRRLPSVMVPQLIVQTGLRICFPLGADMLRSSYLSDVV